MPYWAHSAKTVDTAAKNYEGWQPLAAHLEAVSVLAEKLAQSARPGDETFARHAQLAGLMHDYGKYSDKFQEMLETGRGKPQHSIHGAMLTAGETSKPLYPQIALAIAGHHAGIPDLSGSPSSLAERLKAAQHRSETEQLRPRAAMDSEQVRRALEQMANGRPPTRGAAERRPDICTRMLFSCLVDADRLDSAGHLHRPAGLCADGMLQALLRHIGELQKLSPDGVVKEMRSRVLRDCLEAAGDPGSFFSLSVPTGGGKTLASMAFALKRAVLFPERFRRVIVVIPYLSIIEQNARVYSSILGQDAVLEHHSGSPMKLKETMSGRDDARGVRELIYAPADEDQDDEEQFQRSGLRQETENWNAPLIVTTSVRFFESLFSNRPKDLRRAHNIARSIVVLDEVQTLPRRLLAPLLAMQEDLAADWGVNFVYGTATQPAFERSGARQRFFLPSGTIREIIREPESLRKALVRARILWELETPVGWAQVAERALAREQCLAVVNLREHALQLYEEAARQAEEKGISADGIFHLSTRMCAAHRLRVLDIIRDRLKAKQPCHVFSTQLIEAGVDVDFPLVLRAVAPLDSIVQAAGRADREGKETALLGRPAGEVVVFLPEDNRMPPNEYKEAEGTMEAIVKSKLEAGEDVQVDSAEAMEAYFDAYYGGCDDDSLGGKLVGLRKMLKFSTLADEFEMINSRTKDVFVPDDDAAKAAIEALRHIDELPFEQRRFRLRSLQRQLQRHTVGLSPSEFAAARGVLECIDEDQHIWVAVEQAYDSKLGLRSRLPAEGLVCD